MLKNSQYSSAAEVQEIPYKDAFFFRLSGRNLYYAETKVYTSNPNLQ